MALLDKDHVQPSVNSAKTPELLTPALAPSEEVRQEVSPEGNTRRDQVAQDSGHPFSPTSLQLKAKGHRYTQLKIVLYPRLPGNSDSILLRPSPAPQHTQSVHSPPSHCKWDLPGNLETQCLAERTHWDGPTVGRAFVMESELTGAQGWAVQRMWWDADIRGGEYREEGKDTEAFSKSLRPHAHAPQDSDLCLCKHWWTEWCPGQSHPPSKHRSAWSAGLNHASWTLRQTHSTEPRREDRKVSLQHTLSWGSWLSEAYDRWHITLASGV